MDDKELQKIISDYNRMTLKLEAYKQEVARLQDANADLRIDVTFLSQENSRLQAQVDDLSNNTEVNNGSVPQDEDAEN